MINNVSTKEFEKQMSDLKKYVSTINFTILKDSIENVEKKLASLFEAMEYEEYLDFIKSNEDLKLFDDVLGKFQNNYIFTESMINSLPEEFIKKVDNVVSKKMLELNLVAKEW